MIQADTAWNHETGDTSISVEIADWGVDYRHPDFGDSVVGIGHKWMAVWDFGSPPSGDDSVYARVADHGTAMAGIIGALSNNIIGGTSPFDTSVAGIAGGHGTLPPDKVSQGRGVTLAGYVDNVNTDGTVGWVSSIFESSSRSPNTPFGLGVNVINCSEGWPAADTGNDQAPAEFIPASVNYAYLNGVTFVASAYEMDSGVSNLRNYPSDLPDDPWLICVGGSTNATDREKIQQSDFGHTLDVIAPAGGGDPLGGDNSYVLNYTTRRLTPSSPFTYGPYGGTSSAAANVSGSAALLLSHYVHSDYGDTAYKHIEPEDVQNILKASAWRGDTQRLAHPELSHAWVPHNGYGHLDIGHAFQMLDTDENSAPDAGYHLFHRREVGVTLLDTGTWGSFVGGFQFSPPWQDIDLDDSFAVLAKYLPESIMFGYKVRSRALTYLYIIPDSLENSDTCPAFVWGRSGGAGNPSGWSFADEPNFETGWTKVINGLGSDPDSLVDGIFAPSNLKITLETAQYDVWGWNDTTDSYSDSLGHWPSDSDVAVNFSYFARVKKASSSVSEETPRSTDFLEVLLDPGTNSVTASYNLLSPLRNARIEVYDDLGRLVASLPHISANPGWNQSRLPVNSLASGGYLCRLSGANLSLAKSFSIVK